MENITLIAVNLAILGAVLLFGFGVLLRRSVQRPIAGDPPPLLRGRVLTWPYNALDILGLALVAGVFYVLSVLNMLVVSDDEPLELSRSGMLFSIGFQFFTAAICCVIVFQRISLSEWLGLKWSKWPLVLAIAPFSVVFMWGIFAGLYGLGYMDLMESLGVEKVQETVTMFQEEEDLVIVWMMAVAASLVAPVCEEVVFRGYLYPVAKKFSGPWIAGLSTALVFSAVHGSFSALLPLFIFGMVLALIYELTGSIWAPISVHFLFNSATVAFQLGARFYGLDTLPD